MHGDLTPVHLSMYKAYMRLGRFAGRTVYLMGATVLPWGQRVCTFVEGTLGASDESGCDSDWPHFFARATYGATDVMPIHVSLLPISGYSDSFC